MDMPYQQLFAGMPGYLVVYDNDHNILDANQRFAEDFGSFAGRKCYQVYKHRPEPCEVCLVERTFRDGHGHSGEEWVSGLDGRKTSVLVHTVPIRDDAGELVAVAGVSTDITDLKLLQSQVKASQHRYRQLFEDVPCYISIQDRNLRLVDVNRRFREDFGDSLGLPCYELYKHRREECIPCPVQQTFRDGQVHWSEEVVTSRHGERMNVLVYSAPISDASGEIRHVMEMSTNITHFRELQSQLESIGLLISSISHGIKGMLTGLDGGMYLVNSGMEKGDQGRLEKGWEMVERNVGRIRSMVMNILYYAKEREPAWEAVDAGKLTSDVCDVICSRAREHGVELKCSMDGDPGSFEGDPKHLRSLLINLLENAIDACRVDRKKSGHYIALGVRGLPEAVHFEVGDNGIGMDRETREKAFSLFFSSKGAQGTGLGLFIANKIVRAHGGSIALDSKRGEGSRFTVKLPRKRPHE